MNQENGTMSRDDRIAETLVGLITPDGDRNRALVGVEIGVWRGCLSRRLLTLFPNLTLLMVDAYQPYGDEKLGGKSREEMDAAMLEALSSTQFAHDRRMQMVGDSVKASRFLPDRKDDYDGLDFVYVDGDHSYDGVIRDLDTWFTKIKVGGLFAGHDYDGAGDRQGRFGVKRAVDDWGTVNGWTVFVDPQHIWHMRLD